MGDMTLDLNQSPININFNFNVSFDGRWTPNGHLTVEFSVRWVNALASASPPSPQATRRRRIQVGLRQVFKASVASGPRGDLLDHLSTLGRLWDTQNTLGVLLLKH